MDDLQIIELYHQRSEKAIQETAAKYGNYCFHIAQQILNSPEDAEECTNDTWLKTWQSIPPARPDSLKLFLAKITRNLACNRYNARKSQKRGSGEYALALEELNEIALGTADVETELEKKALSNSLYMFLYSLPQRQCNIFIRRYFYLQSTSEIADFYGLKESNVLMILSRTRQKLKKHLESEGYFL
ncbi:MAG: sigma-70 family RNA polymerase sigma factor [Clostridia bacterium]|nr:sigma-70 family RNA polymerase sigma factor [Clostridia bacterium]